MTLVKAVLVSDHNGLVTALLVLSSSLFIAYFWLNGTKDFIYILYYHARRKKLIDLPVKYLWIRKYTVRAQPKVVMVYPTYNDFDSHSLLKSMKQDYPNCKAVILDDSTQEQYMREIDQFAAQYHVEVVRREGHEGFKAGNLNNYLQKATFDYFVILDSDEVIPTYFITRALDYFAQKPNVGILQANHIATRNRNRFMHLFSIGVDSHWPTYQAVKSHSGFLSLLGHGAMVSRQCYQAAGGFPHLVAEDLCFSIEARDKGYYVAFAPDITCEEEYPISYLAFKKRHSKWTQGNMEFIKRYTKRILYADMTWFEKLDIVLFTYSLPLTAFFALYIVINVILLPLVHYQLAYPVWLLIPTLVFLLAPMLNDIIYYGAKMNPFRLFWYLLHTFMLYGSMFFISLKSSLKSLFGKSTFLVTPKEQESVTFFQSLRANKGELAFAVCLTAISMTLDKSILPVLMLVTPGVMSVYLALIANHGAFAREHNLLETEMPRKTRPAAPQSQRTLPLRRPFVTDVVIPQRTRGGEMRTANVTNS
jgi:cellulose synthase/poly-beta-1,6-N-acetylglucosamine synthase-like glycosyltransferase